MKMLKFPAVYVKHDEVKIEREGKENLHFSNITLSDGLESIELSMENKLVPFCDDLKRGQKLEVFTEERKQGYNWSITVKKISVV